MRTTPLLALAVTLGLVGCGGGALPARPASTIGTAENVVVPEVTDTTFPKLAYELLLGGHSEAQRKGLLEAVVKFQIAKSEAEFLAGRVNAGVSAIDGALHLLHRDEFQRSMTEGRAVALKEAADAAARRGKTGQALAFYKLLDGALPPNSPSKVDVREHLRALGEWAAADKTQGRVLWLNAEHRTSAQLALLYPTQENFDAATLATRLWILEGLKNDRTRQSDSDTDREEAFESYRARQTGGVAVAALFLRDGDAKGALAYIQQHDLGPLIPPPFQDLLEAAAIEESPDAWGHLYQAFSSQEERSERELEPALAAGAAWGTAVELHRSQPGSFVAAGPLCDELLDHGLEEVVPIVVSDTLSANASPQDVSGALSLVWRALAIAGDADTTAAARRIFTLAKPLLDQAEPLGSRVRPSATNLYYVLGALEKRAGELLDARAQFQTATRLEPSVESLTALADIDRQRGAPRTSLQALEQALALAEKNGSVLSQADIRLKSFEIIREIGDAAEAEAALRAALTSALQAVRITGSDTAKVRSELLLARILSYYGERARAHSASERAWEVSQSSLANVTLTLLESARRAFTDRDLTAAREAARRALDAKIADEDLIYVALWLRFLERDVGAPSDGTVEEALASMSESNTWPGQLRAWARGKLSLAGLAKVAKGPIEQTEALFYGTLAQRGTAPIDDTTAGLRRVAESVAIELVEVAIARDLLAAQNGRNRPFKLPVGVTLP
ncbi:MAG: hypothetical protein SFV15_10365 [Polyangiaceae bacterium]|nr:hypothetical protein [Polyangiaceae bacterium]